MKSNIKTILLLMVILWSGNIFSKDIQNGIASWYGKPHHGRKTASGSIYNMYKFTAAHKFLKLGTKVKVTNLKNKKSIIVMINDRGPYIKNRIIDLSYAAAKAIGIIGIGLVRIETIK